MTKKICVIVCSALVIGALTACRYSLNNETSDINSEKRNVSQENNETSNTTQKENEKITIGNVTNVDLDKIISIEICRRNIEEESTCVLNGVNAYNFGNKLINIKLMEFNKKEFNPLTGGDEVYTVFLQSGESVQIIYNGSFEIGGEKYLPAENYQNIDLEVPSGAEWKTVTASKASGE